jgi:serine/threonine protein kinase
VTAEPELRCMGCLEPKIGRVCPICGWDEGAAPASSVFLAPRTVLDGGYLLGNVLGAGGFGITYLAWDLNLKRKLAIKEYFPNAFGTRAQDHCTVVPSSSQNKAAFEHGLEKFLEEGQALAKFQDHPGVVSVVTFFRENGTSYLVMKYEEGITFQEYLKQQGGRIDVKTALDIVTPVMDTLRAIHAAGILHRDISPDNIFINRSGQVKLLDFGAAKHDMASQGKSLQVNLKRGFSPAEQYSKRGKQGPWTDVYALAATIYQAVTGHVPPEALDRLEDDPLEPPSALGVTLPRDGEVALMRALAVRQAGRFQTMKAFQEAVLSTQVITAPEPIVDTPAGEQKRSPDRGVVQQRWWRLKEVWPWLKELSRLSTVRWTLGGAAICLLLVLLGVLLRPLFLLPRVSQFAAEPSTITPGQEATLRWSVDQGSVIINPGIGPIRQQTGTQQVSPAATTTYTLTARRFLRSVTRSATVAVRQPPRKRSEPPPVLRAQERPPGKADNSVPLPVFRPADGSSSKVAIPAKPVAQGATEVQLPPVLLPAGPAADSKSTTVSRPPVDSSPPTASPTNASPAGVAPSALPPREAAVRISPTVPAPPAPSHREAPVRVSGTLMWSVQLKKNVNESLIGMRPSSGQVQGDPLPGVPVAISISPPSAAGVVEPPSPANGWTTVKLRGLVNANIVISILWKRL